MSDTKLRDKVTSSVKVLNSCVMNAGQSAEVEFSKQFFHMTSHFSAPFRLCHCSPFRSSISEFK